jgi:hypothetical protein
LHRFFGRITLVATSAIVAFGLTAGPVAADTAVGLDAGFTIGGNEFDIGFSQTLQSALDTQFVGIEVYVSHGRLILEGYATPGVQAAVLAIIGNLLQNPVPVPVALSLVSPNLGLNLPFLEAGAGLALPDLSGLIGLLGVTNHLRIAR